MRVRYSRRALRQIAEIADRIGEDAPGAATALARRMETLTALLARHPAIGRQTDLHDVHVFALRPYPYLIFYREELDAAPNPSYGARGGLAERPLSQGLQQRGRLLPSQSPSHAKGGPLAGIRVVDMSRLAPGPYCTMLLADLGAEVIVVGGGRAGLPIPELSRGKRFIALDLKSPAGRAALHALAKTADVFVEGFRPGVAARLGAGYDELSALNQRLVYCALTGYGQQGPRAQEAGHDIGYLALAGVLGAIGPGDRPPSPPLNLLADFGGGGLLAAVGILAALLEARSSGTGQFIDAAMIDGALSMMAMHFPSWKTPVLPDRGDGILAGSKPFYRTYACADGKFVAVGALERTFFEALWSKLGLGDAPDHMRVSNWPEIERRLAASFATRTRDAWAAEFAGGDACVAPVLDPDEVWSEPHIAARHPGSGPTRVPAVPRFGRTPAEARALDLADRTAETLRELGLSDAEIDAARPSAAGRAAGLSWPPRVLP